jgi:hypothetical protein
MGHLFLQPSLSILIFVGCEPRADPLPVGDEDPLAVGDPDLLAVGDRGPLANGLALGDHPGF